MVTRHPTLPYCRREPWAGSGQVLLQRKTKGGRAHHPASRAASAWSAQRALAPRVSNGGFLVRSRDSLPPASRHHSTRGESRKPLRVAPRRRCDAPRTFSSTGVVSVGHGSNRKECSGGVAPRIPTSHVGDLEASLPTSAARGTALLCVALLASREPRWGGADLRPPPSAPRWGRSSSMPALQ